MDTKKIPVTCRPARLEDTEAVLELTRTIWDGEDYVPSVWHDWLADPEGLLAVAEWQGQVVGLGKLTRLGPQDWWLEGLRVDPQFEGRGVATAIHTFQVAYWQQHGSGVLRLATASFRYPVHHLCEKSGFHKVAEFIPYDAPALAGPHGFHRLDGEEAAGALPFFLDSPTVAMGAGLMDEDWTWTPISMERLAEAGNRGGAWGWGAEAAAGAPWQAVLLFSDEREKPDDPAEPFVQALACPPDLLPACLLDYRRLMGSLGYKEAAWRVPNHPALLAALEAAGFARAWDASVYVFEKPWG